MTTATATTTTLVLGGTGKTGRRVLERLGAAGRPTRSGSRPGFVWEDRATWAPALDGVGAVYLAYAPDLAVPGAAETVGALAAEAGARGVERIVLLSGRGEPEARQAEAAVRAAGVPLTVLRCSWFAQNFDGGAMLDGVLAGEVVLPVGDVPEPFVDAEDIADVAVAALTQDGHAGEVYELTGPRALTFAEAVASIAAATGRPVRLTAVPLAAYLEGAAAAGVPDDVAALLGYLFGEVLDGRNAAPMDGVQRALGRPPRGFATYAAQAAASGAWDR